MRPQDFKQLERYPNGDIVDLCDIYHLLSEKQIDKLEAQAKANKKTKGKTGT